MRGIAPNGVKKQAKQGKVGAEGVCFLTGFCPCYREILREWFNVNHPFTLFRLKEGYIFAIACLLLASGCAPRFKYAPHHDASYSSTPKYRGVQIERGETERIVKSENEISWSRSGSQIIANALADELKYAKLFRPVDIVKVADPMRRKDTYSHLIQFEIRKFRLGTDENIAQKTGRAALKSQGTGGYFINKAIPSKWVAEVVIEFQLRDARSGARILARTYTAKPRSVTTGGFSDGKAERQQMSEALEEVVKAFVSDIAKNPR